MSDSIPGTDQTALVKYDFANSGALDGLLMEFKKSLFRDLEKCLPAHVVSYDETSNLAVVQPAIHMVTTDGTLVGRAQQASVPVFAYGGGGFCLRFPLVQGSTGWIKSCDRDISNYLQNSMKAGGPNTARMHDFSDSVFYPDVVSGFTLMAGGETAMSMQTMDGTCGISISQTVINLLTSSGGTINLTVADKGISISSAGTKIDGQLFLPHTHADVQSGSDNTGIVNV